MLICARTCVVHATAAVTVHPRPAVLKMLEKEIDLNRLSAVQFVPGGLIRLTFKDPDDMASLVESGFINLDGVECSVTNSDRPHTLVYIHHYPAEGDDAILCEDFKTFGKVFFCKRQAFMGRPHLLTGSRILTMSMEKPIPAQITIDGYPVRIWYRGIKPFCSICKTMGHKAADCPFNGKCRECGEAGHLARNCPSRRTGNVWGSTPYVVPPAADFPPISSGDVANLPGNVPCPPNESVDLPSEEMVISAPGEASNNEISNLNNVPKQSEASEINSVPNNSIAGQNTSLVNNSESGQSTGPLVNDSVMSGQSTSPIVIDNVRSGQSTSTLVKSSQSTGELFIDNVKSGQSTSSLVKSGQSTSEIVKSGQSTSKLVKFGQSTSKIVKSGQSTTNTSVGQSVTNVDDDITEFSSQDSTPVQGSESPDISEFSSPLTRSMSSDGFEVVSRKRSKKRVMVPSHTQLASTVSKRTRAVPNLPSRKGKPQPQPWLS